MTNDVLRLSDINPEPLNQLLARYQLSLKVVHDNEIPGSFWGDEEAGLIGHELYARPDTPIHSILHEGCHFICMDEQRRTQLHTNAEGDYDEENAVCYLQIVLANKLQEMGQNRMMLDMDRWGYSFRLGSARNWFEQDADDAITWLKQHKLLINEQPVYRLRH